MEELSSKYWRHKTIQRQRLGEKAVGEIQEWSLKVKLLSRVRLFATPWTVAYRAPPSVGFSRQESWSGLPFPSPGDLPDPGIEPRSPTLQADALPSEPPGKPHGAWAGPNTLEDFFTSMTFSFCLLYHLNISEGPNTPGIKSEGT